MQLFECIAIYSALAENAEKNLGMRNNYNVALNMQTLEEVIKPFDKLRNEKLEELKKEHGEKEVPSEVVDAFNLELSEIVNEDHEVKLKNIKIGDIPSKTELTAGFFIGVKSIVKE